MYTFVVLRGNVTSPSDIKLFIIVRNILAEILKYLTFFPSWTEGQETLYK
jgi:hypothetical protein